MSGPNRTLQKSTRQQILAEVAYTGLIEGRAVPRLESLALLHEGLDDCNEAVLSQRELAIKFAS